MAFEEIVENIIREAMERGEFENLAGEGRPIDLREYFAVPEDRRVAQALLENAGVAPREIDLMREIGELRRQLPAAVNELSRNSLAREIMRRQLELDLLIESGRRRPPGRGKC